MTKEEIIDKKLEELKKSEFRSRFKLGKKEVNYIDDKGLNTIRKHAYDFILVRLSNYPIVNDGKQTPMRGHPVFIAQHATATCCRECLYKWHGISPKRELKNNEINYIVLLIMTWIEKEYNKVKEK